MATEVAALVARLEADIRDFERGMKKAEKRLGVLEETSDKATKGLRGMLGPAKGLAKTAAAGFGLVQGARFMMSAVNAASNLEESMNAVNVVFGDAGKQITDFAADSDDAVFLAASKVNELATVTGALLTNFGFSQAKAAEETINLTKRAGDMASVFNVEVGEALEAVNAALRGETEPIRRFGVNVDEASSKAKALALGIWDGTGAMDQQQKVAARLALIMEQTAKVQGDAANTADSFANRQRAMAEKMEEAKVALGEALMPAMQALLDLAPSLIGVVKDLAPVVGSLGEAFASTAQLLMPLLEGAGKFFDLAGRGATALRALAGSQEALREIRLDEAQNAVADALADGSDAAAAYANALLHMTKSGTLAAEDIAKLGEGVEFAGQQQEVAVAEVLAWARANEASTDTVEALEDELVKLIHALGLGERETSDLISKYGLWNAASRTAIQTQGVLEVQTRRTAAAAELQEKMTRKQNLTMAAHEKAIQETNEAYEDLTKAVDHSVFSDFADELDNLNEAWIQMAQEAEDQTFAVERSIDGMVSIFEKAPREIDISLEEIRRNLIGQANQAGRFRAAMATLAAAGMDGLVEELTEKGPAAVGVAEDLANSLTTAYELELLLREATGDAVAGIVATPQMLSYLFNLGLTFAEAIEAGFVPDLSVTLPGGGDTAPPGDGTGPGGPGFGGPGDPFVFAQGGVVPGPIGAPVPAIVHGGEVITNPHRRDAMQSGGNTVVVPISIGGQLIEELVIRGTDVARRRGRI